WDSGVNGFDVLKSSWSLRPAGRSAVQVSGQLREVPCAETVVNPEPSNGSPAISSATVIRRVPEVAGGGTGGTLRAKLTPTGRSRATVTEHCVPSQSWIGQLESVESSAACAVTTTEDCSELTGLEQRVRLA